MDEAHDLRTQSATHFALPETRGGAPLTNASSITFVGQTLLPTRWGKFNVRAYREKSGSEPLVIFLGDLRGKDAVTTRVHDSCMTSESLGSLKCDCREQLEFALEHITKLGQGMVIYLQQEGRGIGLANKIAAYGLQEKGFDTVEANVQLGFSPDDRTYHCVPAILADMGVHSIALLTNNPRKIDCLTELGVKIDKRLSVLVPTNPYNVGYMETKSRKMGHLLSEAKTPSN